MGEGGWLGERLGSGGAVVQGPCGGRVGLSEWSLRATTWKFHRCDCHRQGQILMCSSRKDPKAREHPSTRRGTRTPCSPGQLLSDSRSCGVARTLRHFNEPPSPGSSGSKETLTLALEGQVQGQAAHGVGLWGRQHVSE